MGSCYHLAKVETTYPKLHNCMQNQKPMLHYGSVCKNCDEMSICNNNLLGCTEGEVRLVGGEDHLEGRVEICQNDEWGTVCNQVWNTTEASVICRQLRLASNGNTSS